MHLRTVWWGLRKTDVKKSLRHEEWMHQHRLEAYRYEKDQLKATLERTLSEAASLEEMTHRYEAIENELTVSPEAISLVERELAATIEHDRMEQDRLQMDHLLTESLSHDLQKVRQRLRRVERKRHEWRKIHSDLLERTETLSTLISDILTRLPMTPAKRALEPIDPFVQCDQSDGHFSEIWSILIPYAPKLRLRQDVTLSEGIVVKEGSQLSRECAHKAYVSDALHILLEAIQFIENADQTFDREEWPEMN